MVLLGQDQFLTELNKLYDNGKSKGTVTVTIKQVYPKELNKSRKAEKKLVVTEDQDPMSLVRAIGFNYETRKKVKISTSIPAKDQLRFQGMFSNILKVSIDALKKRQKPRRQRKQQPPAEEQQEQ